jgi:hypothetical protein
LAGGRIELSRQGSGLWQTLPTQQQGSRLVARIDDALLPAGAYSLRATAWDKASNQNSTDRLTDGRPMVVTLPLRIPTAMHAGAVVKRVVKRRVGQSGKRRTVRRRVENLAQRVHVTFGSRVRVRGRLENRGGQPLAGADVQVITGVPPGPEQLVAVVQTNARGRYSYTAPANVSRVLRFVYRGTPLMLPVEQQVDVLVSAASTIHARPHRLVNGKTVQFSGRLRALPGPPTGKLIELQVVLSGRWQTFRTTRTDAAGRWKVRYRFRRSCGVIRFRFRARLPSEAAYSFETGETRAVAVRVRGAPCP